MGTSPHQMIKDGETKRPRLAMAEEQASRPFERFGSLDLWYVAVKLMLRKPR